MRVVVAPDSFKGSLTAAAAAAALAAGVTDAVPGAQVVSLPLADGGEGTATVLVQATGGHLEERTVTGPLGEPVRAAFGVLGDGETAVIEMAAAAGLTLVPPARRDPLATTTRGVGELVRAALDLGCRKLIVGLGGSATTDGGAGLAVALGYRLLDAAGAPISPTGGGLAQLHRIEAAGVDPRLAQADVRVACDVDNPLYGPRGAAVVYGPQKGATPAAVDALDRGLRRLADVVRRDLGPDVAAVPGAGAAGGLGFGLLAFARGRLQPGIDLVLDTVDFAAALAGADLVLTGEGRIDAQTAAGKVPLGVARRAARQGVPVVVIAGGLGPGWEELLSHGVHAAFSLVPGPVSLAEAITEAAAHLHRTASQVVRVFQAGRGGAAPDSGRGGGH